jgi:hypothetical protein
LGDLGSGIDSAGAGIETGMVRRRSGGVAGDGERPSGIGHERSFDFAS